MLSGPAGRTGDDFEGCLDGKEEDEGGVGDPDGGRGHGAGAALVDEVVEHHQHHGAEHEPRHGGLEPRVGHQPPRPPRHALVALPARPRPPDEVEAALLGLGAAAPAPAAVGHELEARILPDELHDAADELVVCHGALRWLPGRHRRRLPGLDLATRKNGSQEERF